MFSTRAPLMATIVISMLISGCIQTQAEPKLKIASVERGFGSDITHEIGCGQGTENWPFIKVVVENMDASAFIASNSGFQICKNVPANGYEYECGNDYIVCRIRSILVGDYENIYADIDPLGSTEYYLRINPTYEISNISGFCGKTLDVNLVILKDSSGKKLSFPEVIDSKSVYFSC